MPTDDQATDQHLRERLQARSGAWRPGHRPCMGRSAAQARWPGTEAGEAKSPRSLRRHGVFLATACALVATAMGGVLLYSSMDPTVVAVSRTRASVPSHPRASPPPVLDDPDSVAPAPVPEHLPSVGSEVPPPLDPARAMTWLSGHLQLRQVSGGVRGQAISRVVDGRGYYGFEADLGHCGAKFELRRYSSSPELEVRWGSDTTPTRISSGGSNSPSVIERVP
jgi:hypothetical protein